MNRLLSFSAKWRFCASLLVLMLPHALLPGQTTVITFAGTGVAGLLDGDTLTARFGQPSDIDRDPFGNLIVMDMNHAIRKISPAGVVTTLAGDGVAGYIDGPGSGSRIDGATNTCIDSVGNVYFTDFANQRIRKIDLNGDVTTIAGNGVAGYKDTTAMHASFNYPRGICMDRQGNLYIADSWNHRIRKLDPLGNVTTLAGGGTSMGVQSPGDWIDGPDTSARFWTPCGLEIDDAGNLYLADAFNHRIRRIDPQGMVTTLAGSGPGGGTSGQFLDGAASSARFNTPTGLGLGSNGDVYVADTYNHCIRLVSGGTVSTVAGSTTSGYLDGNAAQALMFRPRSTLVDALGSSVYVADGNNHVLRRILQSPPTSAGQGAKVVSGMAYPNPSAGQVAFQVPASAGAGPMELTLTDLAGAVVWESRTYAAGEIVPIAHLPAGLYFARIQTADGVYVGRFVKD